MEMLSGRCRKHPSSSKQPGICSVCLRDRLLQLADAYNHNTSFHTADDRCLSFSSTSSASPIYFSSSTITNNNNKKKHVRNSSSDAVRSISSYVIGGGGELKKSRSIATAIAVDGRSAMRGSFWKKLLKIRGGSGAGKSRTLKERFDDY